jgi:thymidylate synthase (FAD)
MDTDRIVVPGAEEILNLYFPALDYGFVALKDYMGADSSIEESARVSYGQGTRAVSDTTNLLRYLFRHRHTSPFEMAEMRFHVGLPIFVMRQLVRHRMASLNEYSGRYSIMPLMFYMPEREQVCRQATYNRQGRAQPVDEAFYEDYKNILESLRDDMGNNYQALINHEISRETARIDLPLSTYTFCYWKIDLRNLFNVLSLRCDPHAQWEIRQFADILAGMVKRVAPISFRAFQDYQQYAVTFSQLEMRAIRLVASFHVSPIAWWNPSLDMTRAVEELMIDEGASKREIKEFWEKLKVQTPRDFSIYPIDAKPASYYQQLMADYAVEIPE